MTYSEEGKSRAAREAAVFDLVLVGQVGRALDGRVQLLDSQEGRQVGSVRRYHDEGEEPPHAGDHPRRHGSGQRTNGTQQAEKRSAERKDLVTKFI